jgi:hypothetical protein
VHHPVYHYSSIAYGLWRKLGLPGILEVGSSGTLTASRIARTERAFSAGDLDQYLPRVARMVDHTANAGIRRMPSTRSE